MHGALPARNEQGRVHHGRCGARRTPEWGDISDGDVMTFHVDLGYSDAPLPEPAVAGPGSVSTHRTLRIDVPRGIRHRAGQSSLMVRP
jgi:hypothetical protein